MTMVIADVDVVPPPVPPQAECDQRRGVHGERWASWRRCGFGGVVAVKGGE